MYFHGPHTREAEACSRCTISAWSVRTISCPIIELPFWRRARFAYRCVQHVGYESDALPCPYDLPFRRSTLRGFCIAPLELFHTDAPRRLRDRRIVQASPINSSRPAQRAPRPIKRERAHRRLGRRRAEHLLLGRGVRALRAEQEPRPEHGAGCAESENGSDLAAGGQPARREDGDVAMSRSGKRGQCGGDQAEEWEGGRRAVSSRFDSCKRLTLAAVRCEGPALDHDDVHVPLLDGN